VSGLTTTVTRSAAITDIKVVGLLTFLFQQTNGLFMPCITKIVIIFFKYNSFIIKKLLSIFCAIMTMEVLF